MFFPWYVVLNPRNDSFWSNGISGCSFLSQGLAGLQAIDVPGIENVSSNFEPCAFLSLYPEFHYIYDYVYSNYCLEYKGRLKETTHITRKREGIQRVDILCQVRPKIDIVLSVGNLVIVMGLDFESMHKSWSLC